MDKVIANPAAAVADIPDGARLAVGGFGVCGIPSLFITALLDAGTDRLEVVSNNVGIDDWGQVGKILEIHAELPGRIHVVLIRQSVGF